MLSSVCERARHSFPLFFFLIQTHGDTPLQLAAKEGHENVARELLKCPSIDPNQVNVSAISELDDSVFLNR